MVIGQFSLLPDSQAPSIYVNIPVDEGVIKAVVIHTEDWGTQRGELYCSVDCFSASEFIKRPTLAMAKYRTDCIEKPIRMCFRIIGHFIGTHPWWFFIIPVIISTALGSGFYSLEDRTSNNIEKEFTPLEGPAKMERTFIQEYFPQNQSMFSSLRLNTDGTYACFIATSKTNILTVPLLEEILVLDSKVRNMTVEFEDELLQYVDICATVNGSCSSNAILNIIDYNASNIDLINLTFPTHISTSGRVSLRSTLGSVKINNSIVQSAKAIQLFYYLREFNETRSDIWLAEFIKLLSEESTNVTEVRYHTSLTSLSIYFNVLFFLFFSA